jgi:hypothetical protein
MDRYVAPKKPLPRQGFRMDRYVAPKSLCPGRGSLWIDMWPQKAFAPAGGSLWIGMISDPIPSISRQEPHELISRQSKIDRSGYGLRFDLIRDLVF